MFFKGTFNSAVFINRFIWCSFAIVLFGCSVSTNAAPVFVPTADIETIDGFFGRCPTREEIARIDADLKISIEHDPTAGVEVCHVSDGSENLTALQKRIYQTVYVMRLLHFSRPLPWTEKQLYDWFADAIDGIRFVAAGVSRCCDPENIIVIALRDAPSLVKTDRWVVNDQGDGLMQATLLYAHEARHNQGFLHTCETRNGDDNTLDEMGAWAIHHYLALWIAQYSDRAFLATPGGDPNAYRLAALWIAETTRLTRFCKEVYTEPTATLAS